LTEFFTPPLGRGRTSKTSKTHGKYSKTRGFWFTPLAKKTVKKFLPLGIYPFFYPLGVDFGGIFHPGFPPLESQIEGV